MAGGDEEEGRLRSGPPMNTPSGCTSPSCSMPRDVSSFLLLFLSLSLFMQSPEFRCNFLLPLFQAYANKLFDEMTEERRTFAGYPCQK
jgi:hypothetical protein